MKWSETNILLFFSQAPSPLLTLHCVNYYKKAGVCCKLMCVGWGGTSPTLCLSEYSDSFEWKIQIYGSDLYSFILFYSIGFFNFDFMNAILFLHVYSFIWKKKHFIHPFNLLFIYVFNDLKTNVRVLNGGPLQGPTLKTPKLYTQTSRKSGCLTGKKAWTSCTRSIGRPPRVS